MRYISILVFCVPVFAASVDQAPVRITTIVHADEKSGHLVRSVTVEARPVSAQVTAGEAAGPAQTATSLDFDSLVAQIAIEQGVEESLVHSVIRAESNYNPYAISPKGAQGLMQLIPSTAKRFGVSNSFDPQENIRGGVKYLKFLLDYYQGDYAKTVAAYNAGEKAVDKYNGVPPYAETQNYVVQVARNLKTARRKRAAQPAAQPTTVASSETPSETTPVALTSVGSDGRIYYRTP